MINYRYPAARAGRKQLSVYWQRTRRMTPAVLFVTTSLYGQPTTNSQTRFESMEACEDARIKLMTDAENLRRKAQEAEVMRTQPGGAQPAKEPTPPPMVSAVCKTE
jgi:hypothetical protein